MRLPLLFASLAQAAFYPPGDIPAKPGACDRVQAAVHRGYAKDLARLKKHVASAAAVDEPGRGTAFFVVEAKASRVLPF